MASRKYRCKQLVSVPVTNYNRGAGAGLWLEFTLQRASEAWAEFGTLERELQQPGLLAATSVFLHPTNPDYS